MKSKNYCLPRDLSEPTPLYWENSNNPYRHMLVFVIAEAVAAIVLLLLYIFLLR